MKILVPDLWGSKYLSDRSEDAENGFSWKFYINLVIQKMYTGINFFLSKKIFLKIWKYFFKKISKNWKINFRGNFHWKSLLLILFFFDFFRISKIIFFDEKNIFEEKNESLDRCKIFRIIGAIWQGIRHLQGRKHKIHHNFMVLVGVLVEIQSYGDFFCWILSTLGELIEKTRKGILKRAKVS